jgi:hypothetical protein
MALTFSGGAIVAGSTSVRLPIPLGIAGLTYADVTAYYQREGAAVVSITPVTGTGPTDTWAAGKFYETNPAVGDYDMCFPDAAFASGASWVLLSVIASTGEKYHVQWALTTPYRVADLGTGTMVFQTATNLIEQSLRDVGALDEEDSASTAQITNCLLVLNQIVQSLVAEGFGIFTKNIYMASAGEMADLVSQGYFSPTNALEFQKAFIRMSGRDLPLELWTAEQWVAYPLKSSVGQPEGVFYDQHNWKLYCSPWPVSASTMTLGFIIRQAVSAVTASSAIDNYPVGAYNMIQLLLTSRIAPTNGQNIGQCQMWDAKSSVARAQFTAGDRQKSLSRRKSLYCPR